MSKLFEPFKINAMQIKNRFMRSATHDRCANPAGGVTDLLIDIYQKLAAGGVGLITTGHAYIAKNGKMSPNMLGADRDELIPGLAKLVDSVHQYDAKIMLQLNHAGRHARASFIGERPAAPSALYNPVTDETPRAFAEDEIEQLISAYAAAAGRAVEAGFDAVQIHSAHGYLASQFISPYTNRRTDRWGGSLENRMRFIREVFQQIRKTVGAEYPVTVKLNSEDFIEGGLTIEASTQIAGWLSRAGIDALEISGGMIRESYISGSKRDILAESDEAYFLPNARKIKTAINVPLILVGGLRSPHIIQRLLESGEIEMASMCRPFIREPGLINKWKQGNLEKADCISCGGCQKYRDQPVRCVFV